MPNPPEPPQHIFHWEYVNVIAAICIGWLLQVIIATTVNTSTYCVWVFVAVLIILSWFKSSTFYHSSILLRVFYSFIVFCFLGGLLWGIEFKKSTDIKNGLEAERKEVSENLDINIDVPTGENIYETLGFITNKSKSEIYIRKFYVVTPYLYIAPSLHLIDITLYPKFETCILKPGNDTKPIYFLRNSNLIAPNFAKTKKNDYGSGDITIHIEYRILNQLFTPLPEKALRFLTVSYGKGIIWKQISDLNEKCKGE